ncbi:alpha/beta hydrolase [Nocardioides sp. NPDC127514]|uniref:alpha/beta hydrolase n=1 Tax=unclassified Nocardioides TaxID=2615069 RepID=UPI00331EF7B5
MGDAIPSLDYIRSAAARTARANGGDPGVLPLFPATADEARAIGGEHAAEGFDYYCTPRFDHERAAKAFDWTSVDKMATFDAFVQVPLIGQRPLLMVVGTRAETAWMTIEAFQRAVGPKEVFWIEGASHVDLYDKEPYVGAAVERLGAFFAQNLAAPVS